MKRNIKGSANGANTSFAGATRSTTHAAAPSSAVTGSGSASVIQSTTTAAITAASLCASGFNPVSGRKQQRDEDRGREHEPGRATPALEARLGLAYLFDRLDSPVHLRCCSPEECASLKPRRTSARRRDVDLRTESLRAARAEPTDALLYHIQLKNVLARLIRRAHVEREARRVAVLHVEGDARRRVVVR